jgi:hypothetical protein
MRALLLAVLATFGTVGPVASQAQVRPVAAYWQTLGTTRSVGEARAVPRPSNGPAWRDGDIGAALLKFREYELTFDRTAALEATRGLERVLDRTPKDAFVHYALGTVLARGPDTRARPYAERAVYSIFSKGTLAAMHAPRELEEALRLDPSLEAAAIELGQLAIDFADFSRPDSAAATKSRMRDVLQLLTGDRMPKSSANLMMQSQLQTRLGSHATASALAQKAESAGYDASIASFQRADALFRGRNRDAGTAAYFDGVNSLTDAGADLYFASMELVLTKREADEWRDATLDQRRPLIRRFWEMRAALAGVTVPERLAEHFRRLAMLDGYRSAKTSAAPTAQSVRAGYHPSVVTQTPEIVSIVRFGSGARSAMFMYCRPGWDTLPVPMQPTLQQCQQSPYGRSVLGSLHHGDCPDFPMGHLQADGTSSNGRPVPWLTSERESPVFEAYFNCLAAGGSADAMDRQAAKGLQYAAAKRATKGESFYPAYAAPLAITWEAFQFHGPGTGAEVVAAVGVQRESIPALTDSTGSIDATVTMTLVDTTRSAITRSQTPAHTRAMDIGDASYILMQTSTPAPAGNDVALRIRVEGANGNAGAIAYGTIDVERFPDDSLTISDIVLSPEDGEGTFRRGDVRLTFAPGRAFKPGESPSVYYEVYGATPNASLITQISVEPIRGGVEAIVDRVTGANHTLTLEFEEATTTPLPHYGFQLKRAISLQTLEPGSYRMTITVTDPKTGRRASRTRPLVVVE